jgi:single-stranded DNA-binding protein
MAVDHRYRYVNGMRNIAWLVGFLRKSGDQYFVQQNNNVEQMLPIIIPNDFIVPPEFTPIEAACHVYGKRIDDEQNCSLKVFEITRPSIRSMPPLSTWVRGAKKGSQDDFRPFMTGGEIKREILDKIEQNEDVSEHEKVLAEWFRFSGNKLDSRLGENANKVFLAGFVGATRYVEPNEHQSHGYGEIYLHQHREPERAIPVRLYNPAAIHILKTLRKGHPVAFQGQIRMKILPDDEGNIRSRNLHVRVDEVYATDPGKDFFGNPPDWWSDLFREGRAEKSSNKKPAHNDGDASQTTVTVAASGGEQVDTLADL